jgi:ribonuclease Z
MILVDCPTVSYISALTSSSDLELFYSGSGKIVNCIVHLSPSSVTNCREYRDWMAKFKEAHHIMAGRHGYIIW